jgi:C_GCAxxG_C_C family probable redox protein
VNIVKSDWLYKEAIMSEVKKAVELFKSGCACSQAICSVYGPRFGIDAETAMRISSGFAGGMRTGEVCGAVTGAYMVLGLKLATSACNTIGGRQGVYSAVVDFGARFKALNKSLMCKDLLGCDMGTPEGRKQAETKGLFTTICPKLVEDAGKILEEML